MAKKTQEDKSKTFRIDRQGHSPDRDRKIIKDKETTGVLSVVKRFVKQRPDDSLASLLAHMRELNVSRKDPGSSYGKRETTKNLAANVLEAEELGDDFYYPDVRNGKYALGRISPIRYLSRFIRADTTAVMELGSGWSSNIFQLYLTHGATRSKKIIYYGGEITDEGMICAKYIANLEPKISYRAFRFDFGEPNLDFLVRQRGHILLLHSIAKTNILNPLLFDQLKAIANPVTVVHFEPVGWQREAELLDAIENEDTDFLNALEERALAGELSQIANAAWWSWSRGYNRDLLKLVSGLEKQGSVALKRIEFDFDATANIFNPTTLIHYDFVR